MPSVTWSTMSEIRHLASDMSLDLSHLDAETRDGYRTSNSVAVADICLKRIEKMRVKCNELIDATNKLIEDSDE